MDNQGWNSQEEALYRELEQRATAQARAIYARRRADPEPEPVLMMPAPEKPTPQPHREPPQVLEVPAPRAAAPPESNRGQSRPDQGLAQGSAMGPRGRPSAGRPAPGSQHPQGVLSHPGHQSHPPPQSSGPPHQTHPPSHPPRPGPGPSPPHRPPPHREPPPRFNLLGLLGGGRQGGSEEGQGIDREWVLLALILYVLIKEKANQELVFALVYILLF